MNSSSIKYNKHFLNWKDVLVAFSLSNLFFLRVWHELVIAEPQRLFYLKTPTPINITALLINVFLIGAVILSLFFLLRRSENKLLQKGMALILILSLFFPINAMRLLATEISITDLVDFLGRFGLTSMGIFIVLGILWLSLIKPVSIINFVSIIYLIFSPFLIISIGQAAWALITYESYDYDAQQNTVEDFSSEGEKAGERVVWFIFDELDQRLTFEKKPQNVKIEELKSLKNKGLYATNAYAPEEETILSMPAFITGERVSQAKPKSSKDLILTSSKTGETFLWSERENIFDKVKEYGGHTGLAGVFLPYGRVIGNSLDICTWQPFGTIKLNKEYNLRESMLDQFLAPLAISPFNQRHHAINVHKKIYNDAKKLVTNPDLDLVMVHWSIPHYPWIFDRNQGDFSLFNYNMDKGYFDNLALVDKTLKEMRLAMQEAGTWENTHLIISSDHPWRMNLFPTYDEEFDPRIPFIVKMPGEEEKVIHTKPFNTVLTHDMILKIIRGELSSPSQVSDWLKSAHK